MKIGIIHPSFDVIGGAEQTTLTLMNSLKKIYDVTLYTTSNNYNFPSDYNISFINRISLPIGWAFQRMLEIKKLFKKAKNEDVLLISSGNLVLSETKKPVIVYCHSTFESELKKMNNKKRALFSIYQNYIKNQLENQIKILKKPSVELIVNSNYTKEKIKELFGKESHVIFPPVKINEFEEPTNKIGIITIARYSPEKNLEFNLKTIKKLNVPYKIFGNAKFSSQINYYNHLQNMTKNDNQIKLFLNSKRNLIENSLYSSKIYFQSSKETFGISVIEGIMAGCIPIVPDNTSNKETIPISELRYKEDNENDAIKKIDLALKGNFDKYLDELQQHIKKFSEDNFQKNIINYLLKFENNIKDRSK